ncbi:hypothetical protein ACFL6P_08510 [Candidatus Latescibacterota bacterium]
MNKKNPDVSRRSFIYSNIDSRKRHLLRQKYVFAVYTSTHDAHNNPTKFPPLARF